MISANVLYVRRYLCKVLKRSHFNEYWIEKNDFWQSVDNFHCNDFYGKTAHMSVDGVKL